MNVSEYQKFDGLSLAGLVRKKETTPQELLDCAITLAEQRNPSINAIIAKLYDYAHQQIAKGPLRGPFFGVPYLLKDLNGPLGGIATTRGSAFFATTVPPTDGELVKRLKAAGLVIFGKTNTCELGLSLTCEPRLHGATRNPWNLDHTSGGSSGGSCAAVAARILPMAHATDGFGSIRVPAACCGLIGLKPSRGRISLHPYFGELLAGLATEHAVTRSVRDSAALLDATAGPVAGDPYALALPTKSFLQQSQTTPDRLRVAYTTDSGVDAPVDPECIAAVQRTAKLCADFGHDVEESDPGIDGEMVWETFRTIVSANLAVTLASHPEGRKPEPSQLENMTLATAKLGEAVSAEKYIRATQAAHRLGRQMAQFHQDYDVLLTPTFASPPVKLGWLDMMMEDVEDYWKRVMRFAPFPVWFNMTGQPAMSIPSGLSRSGLPLGVQLSARYGDEATLLKLATQIEQSSEWHKLWPKISIIYPYDSVSSLP